MVFLLLNLSIHLLHSDPCTPYYSAMSMTPTEVILRGLKKDPSDSVGWNALADSILESEGGESPKAPLVLKLGEIAAKPPSERNKWVKENREKVQEIVKTLDPQIYMFLMPSLEELVQNSPSSFKDHFFPKRTEANFKAWLSWLNLENKPAKEALPLIEKMTEYLKQAQPPAIDYPKLKIYKLSLLKLTENPGEVGAAATQSILSESEYYALPDDVEAVKNWAARKQNRKKFPELYKRTQRYLDLHSTR